MRGIHNQNFLWDLKISWEPGSLVPRFSVILPPCWRVLRWYLEDILKVSWKFLEGVWGVSERCWKASEINQEGVWKDFGFFPKKLVYFLFGPDIFHLSFLDYEFLWTPIFFFTSLFFSIIKVFWTQFFGLLFFVPKILDIRKKYPALTRVKHPWWNVKSSEAALSVLYLIWVQLT